MDYKTLANFGPEDDSDGDGCQCGRCNGEPEFYENDEIREAAKTSG